MRMRIVIAGTVVGTAAGMGLSRVAPLATDPWGIDPTEAAKPLQGDELVPVSTAIETRGITIDAPPDAVWPWLVQMGYGRGGWYSYDQLDMGGTSAVTLVPEWASLAIGDIVPTAPGTGFAVRVLEPGRALVLYSDTALVETRDDPARGRRAGAVRSGRVGGVPSDSTAGLQRQLGLRPRAARGWSDASPSERFRVRFGDGGPQFRVIGPIMGPWRLRHDAQADAGHPRDRAVRTAVAPALPIRDMGSPERGRANGRAIEPAGPDGGSRPDDLSRASARVEAVEHRRRSPRRRSIDRGGSIVSTWVKPASRNVRRPVGDLLRGSRQDVSVASRTARAG